MRKIIKTRGHFPSDDAAIKLLWLALRNILADKVRSARQWKAAMNQFAVMYGERFTRVGGRVLFMLRVTVSRSSPREINQLQRPRSPPSRADVTV